MASAGFTIRIKDDDGTYRDMLHDLYRLGGSGRVHVGILRAARIAAYAAYQEYGTSTIPARPFIAQTIDENQDRYIREMENMFLQVLDGQGNLRGALARLGALVASDIKRKIVSLREPPNAPATIRAKGSSNPLVDTGAMLNAVLFEVE